MLRQANAQDLLAELINCLTVDNTLDDRPLRRWREADWRAVLTELPMDGATFAAQFERTWDQPIATLTEWCARHRGDTGVYGYLGLLLLTLQSLRHSERYRSTGTPDGHDCAEVCRPLSRDPAVQNAIRELYQPTQANAEWANLDFATLEFHRHGTTSFILTGRPLRATQGQRPTFALKCIIYPYLRMPTIGRATREYAGKYDITSRGEVRHLVHVWASDDRWILMDFVAGETLADLLRREFRTRGPGGELRLDLLERLGRELFQAMAELDRCGLRHGDLSPSNIIVTPGDEVTASTFKLIDLGVNYLYTHSVTGASGPDAGYVAPEVRTGHDTTTDTTTRADLYSVGRLLVAFGTAPDGGVPDAYYADAPELARFIEDLIDDDPEHRLLIFQVDGANPYRQLRDFFLEELAAVRVAQGDRPRRSGWLTGAVNLFRPLLGMPSRQRRLWKLRREQNLADSRRGAYVRWLLVWSLVSAATWYLSLTVVVIWWLRDLNLDWGNQAVALLQQLTGTPQDQFPYLDLLRADDYPIPDLAGNLPVRVVAFSFAVVSARYYQGLFASITPLAAGLSRRAVTAEVLMRLGTVVPVVLILPATLVERRWWPLLMGVGMTYLFLANWSVRAFAQHTNVRSGLASFAQWAPASGLYAACVWVIGILIYRGELHDVYIYAFGAATINIALWYAIKLGSDIGPIRAGLSKACLAAERTRHIQPASDRSPAQR